MRKIAVLILFISISWLVSGQVKQVEYTAEVPVMNTSAKELHDRCMDWVTRRLNNVKKIPVDSTQEKMIAQPEFMYIPNFIWGSGAVTGTITYTLEVVFNDGKFTYVLNNFVHHGDPHAWNHPINFGLITTAPKSPLKFPNQAYAENTWKDLKFQVREQMMLLIDDLKQGMTKAPEKGN